MTYWHGGSPLLKAGGELLPPTRTGFGMTSDVLNRASTLRGHHGGYRRDRVYATTNVEFAEMFAALYTNDDRRPGLGAVWEVELDDDAVEVDPDFRFIGDDQFVQAPHGRVVRLVTFVYPVTEEHECTLTKFRKLGADAQRAREIQEAEYRAAAKAVRAAKLAERAARRAARRSS